MFDIGFPMSVSRFGYRADTPPPGTQTTILGHSSGSPPSALTVDLFMD